MENKILLCPLVSYDLDRSIRAIKSCFTQKDHELVYGVHVVINSQDTDFTLEISKYCDDNEIKYSITKSDGTPGTGKNSVLEIFQNSEYTHLSQLDGDDLFYPTFLKQIQRHLYKYPTTDVLATLPCDSIYRNPEEGAIEIDNGFYALIWTTHYITWSTLSMLGEDRIFSDKFTGNYGRFILFSKKISKNFRFDSSFIVGEDLKLHFEFLHAHQKDDISYWFTSASDGWVRDTSSIGIQKSNSNTTLDGENVIVRNDENTERLKEYIESTMMRYRSAPCEIPVDFAPIYMTYEEKKDFLNEFIS
jgi:hypothetical protein